jgi:hypothetical protein
VSGGTRTAALLEAVDTMPVWSRKVVYCAGGLLFASGLGMSGFFLSLLGMAFRIDMPFALLIPLALDAGAAVGVVMWVTGTGAIEKFGRSLARLLFGLSILGNGLERMLTFAPIPEPAPHTDAFAILVQRTNALVNMLTTGSTTRPAVGATVDGAVGSAIVAWFLLAVSIGIGIVFPILAYKMSHGIILARKAADAPAPRHKKPVPATQAVQEQPERPGALVRAAQVLAGRVRSTEETQQIPVVPAAPAAATSSTPATAVEPAREPEPAPYVHDNRDLEPKTPEWQKRYDSIPGNGKKQKAMHWLRCEWEAGREPTGAFADRVIDGGRTATAAKQDLLKMGILPPSERPAASSTPEREPVREPVRTGANDSQPDSQSDGKDWGDRERLSAVV